jgi:hypothetical protein
MEEGAGAFDDPLAANNVAAQVSRFGDRTAIIYNHGP